ncbi:MULTISPECIES: YhdP family protein [Halomonadaceae]|uniref:YhdP family phospholipid transporter n=1 Tax=Halomonadaceae TaxID=28256 RepID=UPI0015980832|nr:MULTISPECIES: AsmA-like C-terminal region-containing protein [Halomonas]QJQ96448.1 DUF3971 domain-containing protein [Halomonas sp. PA5]
MTPTRLVLRWTLTIVAIALLLLALLLLGVRLAASQIDGWRTQAESLLSARFNAEVTIGQLEAGVSGLDPSASLQGLRIVSGSRPLLEVERAQLRLNSLASLRDGFAVIEGAHVRGVTLHLYQTSERTWHWPEPAELPPELQADTEFDLEDLDFWVGALLRQRVELQHLRLVLHGLDRQVTLEAPSLLMTGDTDHTHVEGWLHVEGHEEVALEAALEIRPGRRGLADFNAALQARMELSSLVGLAEVLSRNDPVRIDEAEGLAQVWGRWHQGALEDVRLDLDVQRLALSNAQALLELEEIHAQGQWLREEQGWQAWLSRERAADDDLPMGPAIPQHWHLRGDGEEWWLNTSGFELEALAAWRDRIPMPEGLLRVLDALDPRGHVGGFGLGRQAGQWRARGAFHDVAVSPWQNAPGGGPLDAWVEASDLSGEVTFVGREGATLEFPRLFNGPMELNSSRGRVYWDYRNERVSVRGEDIEAVWRNAQVHGEFDLELGGERPGELGLDLAFRDVDAVETPLVDWLPVGIFGEALVEWFALGAAGRVPAGTLSLRLPLMEEMQPEEVELDLALEIRDGYLPFDEEWPALENVEGRLAMDGLRLEAWVERAESHGLQARNGRVSLIDERLNVLGELSGNTDQLLAFLAAMPVGEIDTRDWEGQGELAGELALELPLGEPDGFDLLIDTDVDVPYLRYLPLDLPIYSINGELEYRQQGETWGFNGVLGARIFEGPVLASFDSDEGVSFEGRALAHGLLSSVGLDELAPLLSGYFPYRARLSLEEAATGFTFESDLAGLGIHLPFPFGKSLAEQVPLRIEADLARNVVDATLDGRARLRWREWGSGAQGQLWLEQWPSSMEWPQRRGWEIDWNTPNLDVMAWVAALEGVALPAQGADESAGAGGVAGLDGVSALRLSSECLYYDQRCLGSLSASGYPQEEQAWHLDLAGTLAEGSVSYRPGAADMLDIALARVTLDSLLAQSEVSERQGLIDEIAVAPTPVAFPKWVAEVPDGRLRVATFERQGRRFGPLTARWRTSPTEVRVDPLGLTIGHVSARGELVWEASGSQASLTRSRLSLDGGSLATVLERLNQPIAISNASTRVRSQLAWPGAPWQFGLERSRGNLDIDLRNGRFHQMDSTPVRLIGLLNVDNLLRRLRLDFTDVTRQGTAFDSVIGASTLYGGILETRGPVVIESPATNIRLDGQVDLARRELDQRLSVTVPISQNLPLAALVAGAPVVGGALFIAHQLFGGVIDRATQIHYRVQGPWTSPRISLEGAE